MPKSTISLASEAIGRWYTGAALVADPTLTSAYAAAVNDGGAQYRMGLAVPPLYPVVATVPMVERILSTVLHDADLQDQIVHGEHDVLIAQEILPWSTLSVRGRLLGILPRTSGTAIVTHVEFRSPTGAQVQEHFVTSFLRGLIAEKSIGHAGPPHALPAGLRGHEPTVRTSVCIDPDQTYRYAAASGDFSSYHIDPEAALNAGFPGVIAHGLCVMALCCNALVEAIGRGDANNLCRLAVRFSRPVFPSDSLQINLWPIDLFDSRTTFGFTATKGNEVVLTDGLADVMTTPISKQGG